MGRCSVEDCDAPSYCRGWCRKHYARWQRHGDPLVALQIQGDDDARFMAKVNKSENGCWLWTAYVNPGGYAKFGSGGHDGDVVLAHRWSYERWKGPIPEGWTVDHECHNADRACRGGVTCPHRRCVNPEHLGLAETVAENVDRSSNAPQHKTHCPANHAYDEANTYTSPAGRRSCRRCHADRERARHQRVRDG